MTIMDTVGDFYQILGLEAGASIQEIKKAYFALVRKYPPERFPADFMRIRRAYELLSNEKTRQEYDSIAQLPMFVRNTLKYARQAIAEDRLETAIEVLEELLKGFPGISFVKGFLGEAYFKNGNSVKAIGIFTELVKEHPQNAAFSGYLAHAYLMRGWHLKAADAFRDALALDEDNFSLWDGLAQALVRADQYEKARHILQEALRRGKDKDWDNAGLYFKLIQLDVVTDNLEELEKHLEELTSLAISREDIRESMGWALSQLAHFMVHKGLTEAAKAMIERAHHLVPEAVEVEKLKEELDFFEKYKEQFEKLENDDSIHEDIVALVKQIVYPGLEFAGSKIQEISVFLNELHVLDNPSIFSSLRRLEKLYPDLYAVKKEFFDGVLNAREKKKMLKNYHKKAPRYMGMLPLLLGLGDSFEDDEDNGDDGDDETGNFFEEDEENGESSFSDDGTDQFDWLEPQHPYVREHPKIGRNEPCPCGSGKKYKKCCGK